ncbi:hypothetical protein CEXT_605501 [Caerostris extrusa]|uniref:Uncharacterized protein n=1 Tax=Caerostris extrusa TaxID=172846 RepID=A0AAV4VGB6_CAEEX|nr:hypothetical protein CEXT_605501 [Caerostris extrusa]
MSVNDECRRGIKEKQSRGGSGSLAHGNLHLVRGNPAHPAPLLLSPPSLSISDEWKSLPERRFALLRHRSNARDADPRRHGDRITSSRDGDSRCSFSSAWE